jgi:hypothetical protein
MSKATIYDFLEVIIEDNFTYDFPIHLIREELTALLLSQEEFLYFIQQIHSKLEIFNGKLTADIFTTILYRQILNEIDSPDRIPYQEYALKISDLIATLENIQITRIEKSSPDYEMLKEMSQ